MAVKPEGLRSLQHMLPALLERICTWDPKLINCPFSPPQRDTSPHPQPTAWGCTPSPSGSPEAAPRIPPLAREGGNGRHKGKGEQACFEQKDKEAKLRMKQYHFKGEKIDNSVSHHTANELQPHQPAEAMRSLPSSSSFSSLSSCPCSCLFMMWLMTKQLIKRITQLSS